MTARLPAAPSVCFVGLKCYDQIAGRPIPRFLGGVETQLTALAKGLAEDGWEVSFITFDHGQADAERFAGVTVYKTFVPGAGIRMARFIHPRSTSIWNAMRRADADIYLQMGAGEETGQVGFTCRMMRGRRRRFVYCMASDADFRQRLSDGVEGKIYQYGLKAADRIIAQTDTQKAGLLQATGLPSEVIPMATSPPYTQAGGPRRASQRVLWVGRIEREKRLEWLLEVARRRPEMSFDVVGTPNKPSAYASRLLAQADALPNVRVHGRASGEQIAALYRECRVVCCTSALEGFPTVFLEAWSCGIPVVTTFDPDGIVARHGLGAIAIDVGSLEDQLTAVLEGACLYDTLSAAARRYYDEHHSVETVSKRFRLMLEQVAGVV